MAASELGITQPLYRKLIADFYQSELPGDDLVVLKWWAALPSEAKPRRVLPRNPIHGKIIYTDAATETVIFDIVVFEKSDFDATGFISDAYREVAAGEWIAPLPETNLIYGLELLAAAAQTASGPRIGSGRRNVAFYIDNNNAKMALVRSDSKRRIIDNSDRLFLCYYGA